MSLLNRRVRLGLSAAGAVAVLTISSTLAYAEPTTVDEAKAQLQRLEQEASEIDQQYAAVQAKVELRTSQLATARKDVDAQAGKVQALRSQVGQMALQQFKSRGVDTTTVLLTTDDAASFLNQLSTMHKVNENANVLLQDFQTEQANLSDMQRAADAELASISADQKQLGELSAQSDVKVKAAQAVLDRLTEEQRRKLAEQQAAEAGGRRLRAGAGRRCLRDGRERPQRLRLLRPDLRRLPVGRRVAASHVAVPVRRRPGREPVAAAAG